MKLLLENWRQYLKEDDECKTVIAYHGSPKDFEEFSIDYAQGPKAFYFTTERSHVRKFKPVTYIYEVELTLCGEGARWGQEPSGGTNYVWAPSDPDDEFDDDSMVYKMLDAKDIKILNVEEEETVFDWF
jgi:hypothetical protein